MEALIAALEDESVTVRRAAAEALGAIGGAKAVDTLVGKLQGESADLSEAAQFALADRAFAEFKAGNVEGAAELFRYVVSSKTSDRHTDELRNSLAYCLILRARYEEASAQFDLMEFPRGGNSWPIWQHNRALLHFLTGGVDRGREELREALNWSPAPGSEYDPRDVLCMLLLNDRGWVVSRDDLPVDAAILLNLRLMNGITGEELATEMSRRYPAEWEDWIGWAGARAARTDQEPREDNS